MPKLFYLLSLVSLGSLILIGEVKANPAPSQQSFDVTQAVADRKPEYTGIVKKIDDIAQQITVRIDNLSYGAFGSGVIIAHKGNTYYVLTAKHVLCLGEDNANCVSNGENQIVTPDGKTYAIDPEIVKIPAEWLDLAVVEFQAEETYKVATIGDYATGNQWIFTSGFRDLSGNKPSTRLFTVGALYPPDEIDFLVKDSYSLVDGQDLVYTNPSYRGMSGGAILDSGGRLVGINTASEDAFDLTEDGQLTRLKIGYSLGVSLTQFLESLDRTNIKPEWLRVEAKRPDTIYQKDLSQIKKHFYTVEKQEYTGIVKDIDNIAQNILVKVENSIIKNKFGSGVIVAKEKNTYYVLTAHHVIRSLGEYAIVTRDGNKYPVIKQDIQIFNSVDSSGRLLDVALIKFESQEDYQVATLGIYDLTSNWVFAVGFAKDNNGYNLPLQHSLTAGKIQPDNSYNYNAPSIYIEEDLGYSNVTYPGMSGGAILDSEGKLLGIHTAEDSVCNVFSHEIKPGLSRGVSIFSFLESLKSSQSEEIPDFQTDPNKASLSAQDITMLFEQLIGNAPSNNAGYSDWVSYGNYLWRLGLNQEAINAFERAIKFRDELHEAYYGLGLVYLKLQDYQKAANSFEKAANSFEKALLQNKKPWYWRQLGYSYYLLEDYTKALAIYDKVIKSDPRNIAFAVEKGDILTQLNRHDLAIESLTDALDIKSHPVIYFKRSLAYHRLRQYQQSLDDYNKAIEIHLNSGQSYVNCSEHRTNIEEYESALDRFKTIPLFLQNPENIKQYQLAKSNLIKLREVIQNSRILY